MNRVGSGTRSAKVATRMRNLRHARGWSAARLAAELTNAGYPIRRESVAQLECGARKHVTVDELCAIAYAFGVSPAILLDNGPVCQTCKDVPPPGFVCTKCGAGHRAEVAG